MAEYAGRPPVAEALGRLGFDAIDNKPLVDDPLVLYALTVVLIEVGVLQALRVVAGYELTFVENPLWLLRPPTLIGAAVLTGQLHERYDRALSEMLIDDRTSQPDRFRGLVPSGLGWLFVALGLGFTIPNAVFVIGLPELYATGGIFDVLQFLLVIPFGYVPVLAMFLATYVAIEVVTPRRIADPDSDFELYYLDPEGLGGMRPIGELVKLAYYYLLVGLVVFLTALYGPYILGGVFAFSAPTPPGVVADAGFTVVWVAAVMTMVYGLFTLHQFMRREKRETIQQLDESARGHVADPWDVENFDIERENDYDELRAQLERVSSTKEYPATFTMWAQLVVGVMIPRAVQFVLSSM